MKNSGKDASLIHGRQAEGQREKGESQWFSWRRYSYFRIPLSPWCIHGVPAVLLSYPVYEEVKKKKFGLF